MGHDESKEQKILTVLQPKMDTIPDLHLGAIEESTGTVALQHSSLEFKIQPPQGQPSLNNFPQPRSKPLSGILCGNMTRASCPVILGFGKTIFPDLRLLRILQMKFLLFK